MKCSDCNMPDSNGTLYKVSDELLCGNCIRTAFEKIKTKAKQLQFEVTGAQLVLDLPNNTSRLDIATKIAEQRQELDNAKVEAERLRTENLTLVGQVAAMRKMLASVSLSENDNTAPAHMVLNGLAKYSRSIRAIDPTATERMVTAAIAFSDATAPIGKDHVNISSEQWEQLRIAYLDARAAMRGCVSEKDPEPACPGCGERHGWTHNQGTRLDECRACRTPTSTQPAARGGK